MNKKFFGLLGAGAFAASSAFIFNPAAYGLDGLDTGVRYDSNGKMVCINNGYLFVPTNPDGTAGAPHCFTTEDYTNTPVLADVDSKKTEADLKAVENKSPLDHANFLGRDSYIVKPLTGKEEISPYSEEISRYSLQKNAEINRVLLGANVGWGVQANESIPVYTVDSSNPHQEYATFRSNDNRINVFPRLKEITLGKIPLPTWWAESWSGDHPLAIYDVATGIWRSYFHATPSSTEYHTFDVAAAGYYYGEPNFGGVGDNFWLSLLQGSSSVVGLSNELTQISVDDVRSGSIEHMVSMTWYDYLNMTSFPAKQVSDGRDTYTFAPRPGQMFTLPKDMDIDAYAKKENLDEVTVMIMKAIQKYGGIVTDHNTYTDAFNFEHPAGVGAYARDGKNVWQEDPAVASKISNFKQDYFPIEKLQWLDVNYAGQATATEAADLTPAATAPIGQGEVQQYSAVDAIYQDERAFMRPSDYLLAGSGVTYGVSRNMPEGTTDFYNTRVVYGNEYTPTASWIQYPRDLRSVVPVSGFTGQLVKYWSNPALGVSKYLTTDSSSMTKSDGSIAKWTVNVVAKDQPLARTDTVSVAPGKTISVDVFANDSSEYGKADGATAFTSLKLINSKGQPVDAINTKRGYAKVNGNKIDFTALASSNGQITFTYQGTTADGRKSTGALEIRMLGKATSYTSADVAEISDPIPNQAGTYTPVAKEQTVVTGATLNARDSISNVSELPQGTTFSYKNAVNTTTAGTKSAIVVVKYPDGSSEEVPVSVVVRAVSVASNNDPVYVSGAGTPGATLKIAAPKNSNGSALPSGTTFASDNSAFRVASDGSISAVVPKDAKDGQVISANITVTYFDGTKDTVPVKVTISDKVAPVITQISAKTVAAGSQFPNTAIQTNDSAATVTVTGLPAGMTFDAKTHVISGTPYVAGTYPISVKAVDPSGNTSTSFFTITVQPSPDTATNNPVYVTGTGEPNTVATIPAPKNENGLKIPTGTKFTSSDSAFVVAADGSIKVTVPAIAMTGDVMNANITAVYPDGSSDVIPVKLVVNDKTAPKITSIPNQTVTTGQQISMVTFSVDDPYVDIDVSGLPAGVTYTGSWNHAIVGTPTVPGNYTVTIKVTDRSGNVGTRAFTITVKGVPITDSNDPSYKDGSGTPATTAKIAAPLNSNGSALPSGTTFKSDNSAFKVATDGSISVAIPANAKNGDVLSAKITVTYGDGTTDVVPVKLTVNDKTAPTITAPSDQTLEKSQPVSNLTVKTNDTAATVTVTGLPAGLSYDAKTGAITGTPTTNGDSTVTVKAVDPSGNTSTKTFKISVKTIPANQKNNPVYVNGPVAPGATAKIAAPKNSDGSALPAGVKFSSSNSAFKVASDGSLTVAAAANAKDGAVLSTNITVTYVDGTTDTVPVKVTVGDKVAPTITGLANQSVTVGKAMSNVTVKTDDSYATVAVSGLPAGVSYNAKTGVISGTPTKVGNYTVTVKATDLSGNIATRTFTITVKAVALTDQVTPVYVNTNSIPGATVKIAAPTNSNGSGLPSGTKFASSNSAFVLSADGSMYVKVPANAKDGAVLSTNITVTYSDGTTDTIPVKVTVGDKIAPTIANIADQTVNEGQAISQVAVKTNDTAATVSVSGLPAGVSYNAKTGVISGTPNTPGSYIVSVKAVDPSGNTSVKSFKLTVKAVAQNIKYTPTYLSGAATPGANVKIAAPKNTNGTALPSGTTFKSDNSAFKVASDGSVTVTVPANAKDGDVLSAKITVTYPDGTSEQVPVSVTVGDKTAPVIAAMGNQDIIIGDTITDIAVQTNDSTAKVTVTGLPEGVTYQAAAGASGTATTYTAGVISGAPTKTGTSTVTVKAVDGSGNVSTKTFTIKVNAVPMTNSNTPSYINGFGVPGVALSILAPTNVNGSSVSEGTTFVSDNPAFVVDDSGNITVQVPADAKDGDVLTANITVTYADGTTDVLPVSVTVSDTVAPLVSDIADQSATKGQEIEPIAVKASESAAKVTVSGLPEGVSYNAETGTISGTPTATGNYTVSVLATDLSGNSSTRNFTMTVAEEGTQASEPTTPVETPAPAETTPAPAPSEPVTAEPAQPTQPVDTTAPVESAEPVAPVATELAETSQPAEPNAPVAETPSESAQATQSADSEQQPVADSAQSEQQQAAPAHFAAQVDTSASQSSAGTATSDPSNVSVSSNQVVDSETGETTTESAAPFTFGGGNASNGGVYSYSDQGTTAGNDYYQSGGQESALAYTGANVVGWGLAGISALAGGVVVLGARRRKEEN